MQVNIEDKIMPLEKAVQICTAWRAAGNRLVFTNGVFDMMHAGHIKSLLQAASFGEKLVVGLNADSSVKRLKGEARPIIGETDRALLLSAIACVDAVVLFEEDTPIRLIEALLPDVLVKSADYTPENIVGAKEVISNGGEVKITPLVKGLSTTKIIDKIKNSS